MANVSVIIPCYNAAGYIEATLESVVQQTDLPMEAIVIDDGSTDHSAALVKHYTRGGSRSRVGVRVELIQQENAGESRARNVGIEHSKGEYIAFLDADDLWLREKTARQLMVLDSDQHAVGVHSPVFNFRNTIGDCGRAVTERTKDDPSVEDLVMYHWVAPSTAMVRREVLDAHGIRFNESIRHSEDMLYFADLRLVGCMRLVNEMLVGKRVHVGQQSKNPWHQIWSLENRIQWCRRRHEQLGESLALELEYKLGQKLVGFLENRYWRRDLKQLGAMRDYVRGVCPDALKQSFMHSRRIGPAWVYRLRDALCWRGAEPDA